MKLTINCCYIVLNKQVKMKMINPLFPLFLSFMIFFVSCVQSQETIITDVDVFDGNIIIKKADVVIRDSVIIKIKKNVKKSAGATIIDGRSYTIIPPLINAHVHIARPENLKEALGVGIFALMDMFTVDSRANYLRTFRDSFEYAYYYSSNIGATVPNGHGTQYGVTIPTINDTSAASVFVKERIRLGADYIKISQENTMARLSEAQLHELIKEAHRHNKITVAHISDINDGIMLLKQNVDGFAHIWYRKSSFVTEEICKEMKEKDVFIIPTLSVIEKLIQNSDTIITNDLLTMEQVYQEVNKVYKQGIPILSGTDARNFGMNYTTQLFDEFMLLSKAGMTNVDILKSSTSNIYKAFGLKEFSTLGKNKAASFVLVKGKPHVNIIDIYNEKRIWKYGKEIDLIKMQ